MHLKRHTAAELVFVDSGLLLSSVMTAAAVLLVYVSARPGRIGTLFGAGLFLMGAAALCRKSTFRFDAVSQRVYWTMRTLWKVRSGEIPFKDVLGIGIETAGGLQGQGSYRLAILTPQGVVPMAAMYSGAQRSYDEMRHQILEFLHLDESADPSIGAADEASVLSLLHQGRKIDAIALVRGGTTMSLTKAKRRVDELEEKQRTTPAL